MGETDDGSPSRDAAELLRAAAQPWQRVAAARDLAVLDGHQLETVRLLTTFSHTRADANQLRHNHPHSTAHPKNPSPRQSIHA